MTLIVCGHPASQPSRPVFWTCLLGGIPFELLIGKSRFGVGLIFEGSPRGMVPWIQDGDFQLAESGAIVCYLAEKYGVGQLFPDAREERARILQYMCMHQSLVRLASLHLMAPHVVKPLSGWERSDPNPFAIFELKALIEAFSKEDSYAAGGEIVSAICRLLEDRYFFDDSTYLCGGAQATAADLMCYVELGQFVDANLFDFDEFPTLTRWLAAMRETAFHDVIHTYNSELGDIRSTPNTWDRYWDASDKWIEAMLGTGLVTLAE